MKPGVWKSQVGSFAGQLALPVQRDLFEIWVAGCTDDSWPLREDLDPAVLRSFLPHLLLLRMCPLPKGVEVRLAGSALWDIYGGEITGSTLQRGRWGAHTDYWRNVYQVLLEAPVPMNGHLRNFNGADHAVLFWLRLPLQSRDGEPWLLGLDVSVSISQLDALLGRRSGEIACDVHAHHPLFIPPAAEG